MLIITACQVGNTTTFCDVFEAVVYELVFVKRHNVYGKRKSFGLKIFYKVGLCGSC